MGLLKNLREGIKEVGQMMSEATAMAEQAEADRPLTILNPTPQPEVERLLAAGGIVRGVVVKASHPPQDGERVSKMRVTVQVRSRLADGTFGPLATIKIWTSWKVAALLDRGLEIPVLVDQTTGAVTDIPTDELKRELEPRFGESAERRPGWTFDI